MHYRTEDRSLALVSIRELDDNTCPGGYADDNYGSGTVTFYSYDGRAYQIESWVFPVDLRNVPCSEEVSTALREAGFGVLDATVTPHVRSQDPGQENQLIEEHSPRKVSELGVTSRDDELVVRYRRGMQAYSLDLVGDGTILVHYSYEGLALSLQVRDPEFGVVMYGVPYRHEVEQILRARGIEPANTEGSSKMRPVLDAHSAHQKAYRSTDQTRQRA